MSIIKRVDKHYIENGICEECKKEGEIVNNICYPCKSKKCYSRNSYSASCELALPRLKEGDFYLPCFQSPFCLALRAGYKNWREQKPLDEVPYNGIVRKGI